MVEKNCIIKNKKMDKNIFDEVGLNQIDYNTFDMGYTLKTTMPWGRIVPTHIQEVFPGDKFKMSTTHMIKTLPMIAPVMHDFDIIIHNWFVPYRTLWKGFEDWVNGKEASVLPYIPMYEWQVGSIADYMGLPTIPTIDYQEHIKAFAFAAYNKIWNENYRDQNLQDEKFCELEDGSNETDLQNSGVYDRPYKCAWQHDYFTSLLPFPQKGPDVTLPLGSIAPIEFTNVGRSKAVSTTGTVFGGGAVEVDAMVGDNKELFIDTLAVPVNLDISGQHVVDLQNATSATIADLRLAEALQKYYELNARAGTRYPEYIKAHFGEEIKDYRINYSEYLGGGKGKLLISEIQQNSESGTTPLGTQAGTGYGLHESNEWTFKSEEWGIIMQFAMIVPKAEYKNKLDRWWFQLDQIEWYVPTFANIGEMEVQRKELIFTNDQTNNNAILGYQSRNADMRFNSNRVTGLMKTDLAFWTCTREIPNNVVLDEEFIQCTPNEIIWPIQDDSDKFVCVFQHNIKAGRKLPLIAIPSLV